MVGELIPGVGDERRAVILPLSGVFGPDDARSNGGDEKGILVRDRFPLRVDDGLAGDRFGKVKGTGIRRRTDGPPGKDILAVYGSGRRLRHTYRVFTEETGGEAQHIRRAGLRSKLLPVGAEGDEKQARRRTGADRTGIDGNGAEIPSIDKEIVIARLHAVADVIGVAAVRSGGMEGIRRLAAAVAVFHNGVAVGLAVARDLFMDLGVPEPHGTQRHIALDRAAVEIPCVLSGIGVRIRRPMDKVVKAVLQPRHRILRREDSAAIPYGLGRGDRTGPVSAQVKCNGEGFFLRCFIRRRRSGQQRETERKRENPAENTPLHFMSSRILAVLAYVPT